MVKPLVIDTRRPGEFARSHVEGALNIPPTEFLAGSLPKVLQDAPKDMPIVLYCVTGQRSNTCASLLRQFGFENIINGINEHRTRQLLAGIDKA